MPLAIELYKTTSPQLGELARLALVRTKRLLGQGVAPDGIQYNEVELSTGGVFPVRKFLESQSIIPEDVWVSRVRLGFREQREGRLTDFVAATVSLGLNLRELPIWRNFNLATSPMLNIEIGSFHSWLPEWGLREVSAGAKILGGNEGDLSAVLDRLDQIAAPLRAEVFTPAERMARLLDVVNGQIYQGNVNAENQS